MLPFFSSKKNFFIIGSMPADVPERIDAVSYTHLVDANGTVTDCKLEGAQETESIGGAALEELSKQVVAANGPAIDLSLIHISKMSIRPYSGQS